MNELKYEKDKNGMQKAKIEHPPMESIESIEAKAKLEKSKSKKCPEVVYCSNRCLTIMNRDRNASINIMQLLKNYQERNPWPFFLR